MLILNPGNVKFGSSTWEDVGVLAVNRKATEEIVEWNASGPHAAFADVARQRVEIVVRHALSRGALDGPRPGDRATLVWFTSPTASDAGRRKATADVVVLAVKHECTVGKAATREVSVLALSTDGAADPITLADAGSEIELGSATA